MRKFILLVSTFMAFQAAHAVRFESDVQQDPIVIVLTTECDTAHECFSDGTLERIHLYLHRIAVFNSRGFQISGSEITTEEWHMYKVSLGTASPKTPVTVTIDRKTLTIISVRTTVDVLAEAEHPNNEG